MTFAAWVLAGGLALAQDGGFDAHGFNMAAHDGDLRDPLVVQRPGPFVQGDWWASGLAEYAKAPLVRVVSTEQGVGEELAPVVDNLLALNLSAGVAAHERIRFDLAAPIYGLTTDQDLASQGPAMGDIRLTSMLVAVRPDHVVGGGGAGLALVGHVDIPSGTPARFLGQSGVAGGVGLAGTYEGRVATLSADVGTQFNPSLDVQNLQGTDSLTTGLGVGFLTSDTVGVTVEATAAPSLQSNTFSDASTLPPAEAILSLRYRSRTGAYWTFGAAGGLTDGPGVAAFRVFVGGGYAQQEPPRQPDSDTVLTLRTTDLCPLEPETVNGWKDDDGCPDRLGTLAVDVRYRGEARSADAEILGPDDRSQQRIGPQGLSIDAVPGTQWTVKATDGCLQGEGSATAADVGAQLVVALEPVYDAKVLVEVIGADDKPLDTAQVIWQSAQPECIPPGPTQVNQSGMLEQDIASGLHKVVVTAPSHTVHEEDVSLIPGDDRVIRIKLAPSLIVVEKKQIRILEKVQFETAKAVIRPESFGLLDEVAATIITNPDLGRVEVAGHTDSRGSDEYNQGLSEDRAGSVRTYLLGKGVEEARLISVGYGETRPIDTNKTPEGREVNRRVEFNLLDAKDDEEGEAP